MSTFNPLTNAYSTTAKPKGNVYIYTVFLVVVLLLIVVASRNLTNFLDFFKANKGSKIDDETAGTLEREYVERYRNAIIGVDYGLFTDSDEEEVLQTTRDLKSEFGKKTRDKFNEIATLYKGIYQSSLTDDIRSCLDNNQLGEFNEIF